MELESKYSARSGRIFDKPSGRFHRASSLAVNPYAKTILITDHFANDARSRFIVTRVTCLLCTYKYLQIFTCHVCN